MKLPAPHPALAGMAGLSQQIDRLRNGARWRALQRRFDQCAPRERLLLIGAATAVALMLADGLWLGPALAQFRSTQHERLTARAALLTLQTENSTLSAEAPLRVGWIRKLSLVAGSGRGGLRSSVSPSMVCGKPAKVAWLPSSRRVSV